MQATVGRFQTVLHSSHTTSCIGIRVPKHQADFVDSSDFLPSSTHRQGQNMQMRKLGGDLDVEGSIMRNAHCDG